MLSFKWYANVILHTDIIKLHCKSKCAPHSIPTGTKSCFLLNIRAAHECYCKCIISMRFLHMRNLFFVETSNELLLIWRTSFCDRFITYIFETNTEYLYDIFRPPFSHLPSIDNFPQLHSLLFVCIFYYTVFGTKTFSFRRCRKFYHWHEKLSWKFTVQMLFVKHTKKTSLIRNCRKIFRLRLSSLKISAILLNHKIHAISWMWLHALFPSPPSLHLYCSFFALCHLCVMFGYA